MEKFGKFKSIAIRTGIDFILNKTQEGQKVSREECLEYAQSFAQNHACNCDRPIFIEEEEEIILLGTLAGITPGYGFRVRQHGRHFVMLVDAEDGKIIQWIEVQGEIPPSRITPPVSHQGMVSMVDLSCLKRRIASDDSFLKEVKDAIGKILKRG